MLVKRIGKCLALILLVVQAAGCGDGGGDSDGSSGTFATTLTLRDAGGNERMTFASGETVTMVLERDGVSVRLRFGCGTRHCAAILVGRLERSTSEP